MITPLEALYTDEIDLHEQLAKIKAKPIKKAGDIRKADKLEQAIVDIANKIRELKANG